MPEKNTVTLFDDRLWKEKNDLGNVAFAKQKWNLATKHYLEAKKLAIQLFHHFRHQQPTPDCLTPILIISYLNLAECYAKQNSYKKQINHLFEIYEALKNILEEPLITDTLALQIYQGISKIHLELSICLKISHDPKIQAKLENDFLAVPTFYQAQTLTIN